MKFAAIVTFVVLALGLGGTPLRGQSQSQPPPPAETAKLLPVDQEAHHQLMYATSDIELIDVLIPPGQSALMYPQNIDYVSITLAKSKVSVNAPGQSTGTFELPEGAVRFYAGGAAYTLTNNGNQPYHALTLAFLNTKLTGRGCRCTGGPTDSICNCPGASKLPPDWSITIGHVFLRGVTLAPGATYDNDSTDTTRFLVAVTPFNVLDNTIHEPRSLQVRLPAGRFHWLGPGPHQVQNLASTPLRFVCVEF